MPDLAATIADAAVAPAKVSEDGATVESHSLSDQIAADRYLREREASGRAKFPLRIFKISPGPA